MSLEDDIVRIKEFVRHSAEFIAYFELSDSKIHDWHAAVENRLTQQEALFSKQQSQVTQMMQNFEELLTQAGLARFRVYADNILQHSETRLQQTEKVAAEFCSNLENYQTKMNDFFAQYIKKMDNHCTQAVQKIDQQLSAYDADHFRRIASDSCDQVEKVAQNAVKVSSRLLKKFQWGTAALVILTSALTAFVLGLYVSDEWPWEIHQNALNEREAGKILIKAWPSLTHLEKNRVLQNNVDWDS